MHKGKNKFNAGYIYNTVDIEKNSRKKEASMIENKILFVGRLSKEKNLPRLLKIVSIVKKTFPGIILDI